VVKDSGVRQLADGLSFKFWQLRLHYLLINSEGGVLTVRLSLTVPKQVE
jgi:hypothetical protein